MGIQRVRQYQSLGMLDDPQSWIRKHLSDHAAEASLRIQDFDHNRLANLHQDVTTTASPTLVGLTLSGLTASKPVFTSAAKALVSTGTLAVDQGGTGLTSLGAANAILGVNAGVSALEYKGLAGTTNRVTVTHAAGSITLSGPQDIATTSSPSFYGLTIPQQNSTTGVVIKNAATFDPAYPPLSFQDSTGADVGKMFISPKQDIIIGLDAGLNFAPSSSGYNVLIGQGVAELSKNSLTGETFVGGISGVDADYSSYDSFYGYMAGNNYANGDSNTYVGAGAGYQAGYAKRISLFGANTTTYIWASSLAATPAAGAGLEIGHYRYLFTYTLDGIETACSGWRRTTTPTTAGNQRVNLAGIPTYSGPRVCTTRNIYRTKVHTAENMCKFYLLTTIGDNTTATYADTTADAALGAILSKTDNIAAFGNHLWEIIMPNTLYLGGGAGYDMPDVVFGDACATTAVGVTLHSQGGSGADVVGADLTVAPGQGTGTGAGGSFKVQVAPAGVAGSTWNALTDALVINSAGQITTGNWHGTTIAVDHGGTGLAVYTKGALILATDTGVIGDLDDVAVGSYLASGGTNTVPAWATLNQAAVAGLTTADGPTFAHLHLTDVAAITTAAESWVGPSSTAGIYFKGDNVGIGTTVPNCKVSIAGDYTDLVGTGVSHLLMQGVTDATKRFIVGLDTTNNYAFLQTLDSDYGWGQWGGNGALVLQPIYGNVGIGTTTPTGKLDINGNLVFSKTPDIVSAAGAISVTTPITHIVTNGVGTVLTLAAGVEGQIKYIVLKTLTSALHTDVITPDGGGAGFTTITMDAVGDAVTLLYTNAKWTITGSFACAIV